MTKTPDPEFAAFDTAHSTQAGPRWGWPALDKILKPMAPGEVYLVGARATVGKSAFVMNIAQDVSIRQGRPVVFCGLEMTREEYIERVVASEARVPLLAIQTRELTAEHRSRIGTLQANLRGAAPCTYTRNTSVAMPNLAELVERNRPALLVVDPLQYVSMSVWDPDLDGDIPRLVRALKRLAKHENVSILCTLQMGVPEERAPRLEDIEGGAEAVVDADAVLFLDRKDSRDVLSPRAGEIDVIVAKQRGGPTGTVALSSQLHFQLFSNLARWGE